jgi:hypothetical protein
MQLKPKLTKAISTMSVEWDGDQIDFSAKRHCLTPELMEQMQGVEKSPMQMAHVLANALTEWSYTDVDCTNAEELGKYAPMELLGKIIEKIGETWSGNAKKPEASAVGSAA